MSKTQFRRRLAELPQHVDDLVYTSEVDAVAFDESHGGLFRKFHHEGQGTHRLNAHVGAGQITLR